MHVPPDLFTALNSCRYLFLRHIEEPNDNQLRLLIEEGNVSTQTITLEVAGVEFTDLKIVTSTNKCLLFEIVWESYVAYSVRNEAFTTVDEYEELESGKIAVVYRRSRFLDFVAAGTFASEDHPGPFRHFGLNCQNHIVDVVSAELPSIRALRPVTPELPGPM